MHDFIQSAIEANRFLANAYLADIPEDKWTFQPPGLPMHPASITGHILACNEFTRRHLGGKPAIPDAWLELFGNGADASAEPAAYPGKAETLALLAKQRDALLHELSSLTQEQLLKPVDHEMLKDFFPNIGSWLVTALTSHEAVHLGQLSAWRRAAGLSLPV